VPENILDRRILRHPEISRLANDGCKFQVRSAFLQGLMLINPDDFPKTLTSCRKSVKQLHDFAINHNLNLIQLLLSYAMKIEWADSVVVGANSVDQVRELTDAANNQLQVDWEQFESIPEPLIDPRNWN
jgi:aryl-alcohol dehydrogenase-like predicted oxidoreductase